jgi:hypothetical protein
MSLLQLPFIFKSSGIVSATSNIPCCGFHSHCIYCVNYSRNLRILSRKSSEICKPIERKHNCIEYSSSFKVDPHGNLEIHLSSGIAWEIDCYTEPVYLHYVFVYVVTCNRTNLIRQIPVVLQLSFLYQNVSRSLHYIILCFHRKKTRDARR